jgi:hypothetical protein
MLSSAIILSMPSFRIHRLKDHLRQAFRSAPHVSGRAMVKPRDYEPGESIEAGSPYGAFFSMRDSARPLEVGDLVEAENGSLRICKFVGFEEAEWVIPEGKVPEGAGADMPSGPQPAAVALE